MDVTLNLRLRRQKHVDNLIEVGGRYVPSQEVKDRYGHWKQEGLRLI